MSDETHGKPGTPPTDVHAWLPALFDESPMAIGFSRDGVMLDANSAYLKLFGYGGVEELRGRSILNQIAPSHRPRITEMVAARAQGGHAPQRYETRGLRKDGSEFPFDITTTRVVLEDGPITIAFISDVSARDEALDAFKETEERFRALASAAFEGVFIHTEGRIVLVNETGAAMFGADPKALVGEPVMDLIAPESRQMVIDRIRRDATNAHDVVALRKDGSRFLVEVQPRTVTYKGHSARVVILRDVTDRRRAEAEQRALAERVRHAQKLESLGVLAGGVAHDFNNILTVISNGIVLAKRDAALASRGVTHLDAIGVAAERAADLCRQLLAYAGKAALTQKPVDLSALVAEMSSMLEVSIAKKAALKRELAPRLPPLLGDATQIRQVVMNLVLNASEAIGDAQGTVAISTGVSTYGAETLARSAAGGDPKPGKYVHVEVCDDGVGMDPATLSQMFDPFFTTKFMGRGLGMAAVLGIVRGHAGAIDVESAPGKGTRVRVLFPASEAPLRKDETPATPFENEGGLVLVVDDERNIRATTKMLLEGFGFEVLVAADGVEAIEVVSANVARISAVLLDLTMPRMNGFETMKELRRMAPAIPIVLTTGYGVSSLETRDSSLLGATADAVLAKPYGSAQLVDALRSVMHSRRR